MNQIQKKPITELGYRFIPAELLPKGKDEYHLRNLQNRSGITYRQLTAQEIEILVRNNNNADNWNNILVSEAFNPELVKNCKFFGLVRIGKLEPYFLEFHAVRMPVGLYNSTIISCDFGDNVVVMNVNYLSHYIIGNEVIIANVNEMGTTNYAKFGNGIVKQGEEERIRIWLEVCNENGGRSIIPFNGMLPGDAWLWSRNRDNAGFQAQMKAMTEARYDKQRGYYGKVGDRTVIKNCKIIKDVWIGSDAYLKGANKLKNLTINSSADAPSQIGEGCEMVNGIMGYGGKAFYGVKAVRFIMGSNTQLKYGARLINSYLGDNSTISCCEVLNALIFPGHEQHHNNSFLCAATVLGQSNIPAGATLGSNHNSRSADGEIIAGRGFWPALCVSIKHNSKFASYTLLAKGDYPAELNIPIPFSLVSNDTVKDQLIVLPGYWFMYNMYALVRNARKYAERDKRAYQLQQLEYHFLAPDTINEMFDALALFRKYTGKAILPDCDDEQTCISEGHKLLEENPHQVADMKIVAEGFENTKRNTLLIKLDKAYPLFKRMIVFYAVDQMLAAIQQHKIKNWEALISLLPARPRRSAWENVGGQLIRLEALNKLKSAIASGKIKHWEEVHDFYRQQAQNYAADKLAHAYASLLEVSGQKKLSLLWFKTLLKEYIDTKTWMTQAIHASRKKDYENPFRKMVYDNDHEMEAVVGKLEDNAFIKQQFEELEATRKWIAGLQRNFAK